MIEFINVYKKYHEQTLLDNINLFVQEGEIFGIIGRSGAGKSSLLRCINRLDSVSSGNIIIDNVNITALGTAELRIIRHKIAIIFQNFNLIKSKNIFDNVALPLKIQGIEDEIIQNKVTELLNLVELSDKKFAYPEHLSGGQKQRVAIARALSHDPKILLCDEATSALDPKTTKAILKLLKKINKLYGITLIVVSHEMEVIKEICHRVAVIDRGEIVEVTPLNNILAQKNSAASAMIYENFIPKLPDALQEQLLDVPTNNIIISLLFVGKETTHQPFISAISRKLNLDINILSGNIEIIDDATFGILLIKINADKILLKKFLQACKDAEINTNILGYLANDNNP
jgi:D-methionine transport system ATP-binding protein